MERGKRKELVGVVVSDKMDKTRIVIIESWKVVPIYGKRVRSRRKVAAHDESNSAAVGDRVRLVEMRPMSKTKRWLVAEVLEKSRYSEAGGGRA